MKRTNRTIHRILTAALAAVMVLTATADAAAMAVAGDDPLAIGGFTIRSQRLSFAGILIARPDPLHRKIADILYENKIGTLEDYSRWLLQNIRYQEDEGGDVWSLPDETLDRGFGDCEDFAFLTSTVIQGLGFKPRFLAMTKRGRGHAICAFEYKGHFVWFDNAVLMRSTAENLEEFVDYLVKRYHYDQMAELNPQTSGWDVLYEAS